jgi:hypothetical protein
MSWTNFWTYFGRIDNVLGIVTVILAAYAAYRLWQQNKRLIELVRQTVPIEDFGHLIEANQGINSQKPVALAVCLLSANDSIEASVKTFLRAQVWDMPVEPLNMNGLNNAADLEKFVNLLREKRREFEGNGYTEIHLFVAGPVQAGTIIGGLYRNWIPIKLYHKPNPTPPQVYEYWMPLV